MNMFSALFGFQPSCTVSPDAADAADVPSKSAQVRPGVESMQRSAQEPEPEAGVDGGRSHADAPMCAVADAVQSDFNDPP